MSDEARSSMQSDDRKLARIRHGLAPLLRPCRVRLCAIGVCSFGNGLAEAAVLVIIARIAFALTKPDRDVAVTLGPVGDLELSVPFLLGIGAALVIVKLVLQSVVAWQTAIVASSLTATHRRTLAHLFLEASWALQSNERQGRFQEYTTTYVAQTTSAVVAVVGLGVNALHLVGLLATAVLLNPVAAVAAAGALTALGVLLRPLRGATRRNSRRTARANLAFATAASEMTAQAREIRVFDVGDVALQQLDQAIGAHERQQRRTMLVSRVVAPLYQSSALLLIVMALAIVDVVGTTRLASLGATVLILLRSLSYGQAVQSSYQSLQESAPYVDALAEEQTRYRSAAVKRDGLSMPRIDTISFQHVWFEYDPAMPVLRDVSFSARRGEVIGVIGPSGSGKSTLVQLLLRLRDPNSGRILADDVDSATIALDDWYERLAFVPQEPRLFSGTVAENIRFLRSVDQETVERAARLAHIDEEITRLPAGFATHVGEQGMKLSGGQRQRLCIARALIGSPDVLVLDEPTSALDARSESLIRETLTALTPMMLIVIIAHRLSTLDVCNRIMVLEDGAIRGFDTPERLQTSSAFYQEALRIAGLS